jgi:hypothetical protein
MHIVILLYILPSSALFPLSVLLKMKQGPVIVERNCAMRMYFGVWRRVIDGLCMNSYEAI